MNKWEYCIVVIDQIHDDGSHWTVFKPDQPHIREKINLPPTPLHDKRREAIWAYIANLGLEGWELCSASPTVYHFKRQLE